jgi:hypothetical protein
MLDQDTSGDRLRVTIRLHEPAPHDSAGCDPTTAVVLVRYVKHASTATAHVMRDLTTNRSEQRSTFRPCSGQPRLRDIDHPHTERTRHR